MWLSSFPLKIKTYNFLQGVGWRGGQRTCEGDRRTGNECRGREENAIHTDRGTGRGSSSTYAPRRGKGTIEPVCRGKSNWKTHKKIRNVLRFPAQQNRTEQKMENKQAEGGGEGEDEDEAHNMEWKLIDA